MRIRDVAAIGIASVAVATALVVARPASSRRDASPSAADPSAPPAPIAAPTPTFAAPKPIPLELTRLPEWAVESPESAAACTPGMLLIDAMQCPFLAHRCADGGARGEPCHRWVPEVLCEGDRRRMRFCVDRLEYPNQDGVRPVSNVSFAEAERACAAEDKRLCTVREWELACEGPALWPLPTGVRRDPRACAIDRARFSRSGLEPGGRRLACASPFGLIDAMGGVDEWVLDETGGDVRPPLRWVLAGGSSAGGRPCRAHARESSAAARTDAGFRCCADATAPRPDEKPRPAEAVATADRKAGERAPLPGWTALAVPDRRE